jgi:hypothetical protein
MASSVFLPTWAGKVMNMRWISTRNGLASSYVRVETMYSLAFGLGSIIQD